MVIRKDGKDGKMGHKKKWQQYFENCHLSERLIVQWNIVCSFGFSAFKS